MSKWGASSDTDTYVLTNRIGGPLTSGEIDEIAVGECDVALHCRIALVVYAESKPCVFNPLSL